MVVIISQAHISHLTGKNTYVIINGNIVLIAIRKLPRKFLLKYACCSEQ